MGKGNFYRGQDALSKGDLERARLIKQAGNGLIAVKPDYSGDKIPVARPKRTVTKDMAKFVSDYALRVCKREYYAAKSEGRAYKYPLSISLKEIERRLTLQIARAVKEEEKRLIEKLKADFSLYTKDFIPLDRVSQNGLVSEKFGPCVGPDIPVQPATPAPLDPAERFLPAHGSVGGHVKRNMTPAEYLAWKVKQNITE